ncbi:MAG: RluA family pseudouridine synthase [Bacteroidales bacterium]|nr:RluA family pseudouridine synthase [Bacteroidales bacterium]
MNNPFQYTPSPACDEAFRSLIALIDSLRKSHRREDDNFCRELEAGKMLGVLIAEDEAGERRSLYAFSGQLGDGGFRFPGFVGPVLDYLRPDGYFKTQEVDISRQNLEIARFEREVIGVLRAALEEKRETLGADYNIYKEYCRESKLRRDELRKSGAMNDAVQAELIRQSQYEKAELNRKKKALAAALAPYERRLDEAVDRLEEMKERRRSDSERLQQWLFANFRLLNARGESRSLSEIFAETALKVPPSGAGECCAPKLLQEAYVRGWRPVEIAEYWYGCPKGGEVRIHGEYYPACRGKCLPVLEWMLGGLEVCPPLKESVLSAEPLEPRVVFENRWFCIVEKPSGMLSVPGKRSAPSVEQWLAAKYGAGREVRMAHRLDQDTSGLMVATFGSQAYRVMQSLFATRGVAKTYVAVLDGDYRQQDGVASSGRIDLALTPDWLDRPRQRVDTGVGKEAVTDYEFVGVERGRSRVIFHPLTGRTHQLRVHSASALGLGMPIVGDRLYGRLGGDSSERLNLHAARIEFTFPLDGEQYVFESIVPF